MKIFNKVKTKHLIFSFLIILAAIFFWGYLSLFFKAALLSHLFYLSLVWLVFLILYLLFIALVDNRNLIYLVFIISSACFFLFFYQDFDLFNYYLVGVLVFLLFLLIGTVIILNEKADRLKFSLRKIWKKGLPCVIIAFALIISLVYYFNPLVNINQENIEIPTEVFSFILKPASGIMGKLLPFYSPDMTVDQTLSSGLILQGQSSLNMQDIPLEVMEKLDFNNLERLDINKLMQDPEISTFLKDQVSRGSVNQSLLKQEREKLSETLGVELKGSETMDEILANLVNSKIDEFIGPYSKEVSIGIAVALFLILQLVGRIFILLASILARIVFSILMLFKIAKIKEKQKIGETVEF